MDLYRRGLRTEVQEHLNHGCNAKNLRELIRQSVLFDEREYLRKNPHRRSPPYERSTRYERPAPTPARVASVSVNHTSSKSGPLSDAERKFRRNNHLCHYCGKADCSGVQNTKNCSLLLAKNPNGTKVDGARK
jgi:hypothetical protein